jgi:phosphatidate cytidylyltransferase
MAALVLLGAGAWEWGRLNSASRAGSLVMGMLVVAAGLGAWMLGWTRSAPALLWWGAGLIWVVGGALALRAGPAGWPRVARPMRWVLGLLALWLAWLALAQARHLGINFVLSVMCLVWAADIAAYAGGRSFGRRKLARSISPGKTWEGAASGAAAVVLLAFLWLVLDRSFAVDSASLFGTLHERLGTSGMIAAVLFLTAMGIVGDLMESLVKRAAGAKDSSGLLPGHGGVLDRVDALLPVFPLAMALGTLGTLGHPR